MKNIPGLIKKRAIFAPDILCGGTPCQAFSLAGWKKGLNDDRGNLTIKFVDIIEANDEVRLKEGLDPTMVFWENVEGVLTDKTNAFGCFVASLAGLNEVPNKSRWPSAGMVRGNKRNVAWRVLDAKFFGLPQQRRRLYLLAGGRGFNPENILFEQQPVIQHTYPSSTLSFVKDGHHFEVFREYTDCLYSAYGTKWNGNAAAYNGSLYVVQDGKIRRLSPLECERLMGFPDNYTNIPSAKKTNRYQAIGNSWAIPVVRWIGSRLNDNGKGLLPILPIAIPFFEGVIDVPKHINASPRPSVCIFSSMVSIVSPEAPEEIYLSPAGCYGIVRRKQERNFRINPRLEEVLLNISSNWTKEEIEKRSLIQKRGTFAAVAV